PTSAGRELWRSRSRPREGGRQRIVSPLVGEMSASPTEGGCWRKKTRRDAAYCGTPSGRAPPRPRPTSGSSAAIPPPPTPPVGAHYYIATSTFEWYPGVQIHHSRDLVNWTLVRRPLERKSQLDMRGNPDSCGVWAPCLSHADGQFFLVYTDVKRFDGNFKDAHNYIVTSPTVEGEWSDPIYVNSSGFDPSLFHDDDGRKWFLNM